MTPAERDLLRLINQRIARLSPDMQRAYLRAIAILRESLTLAEIVRRIESGSVIFDAHTIERALLPYRDQLRTTVADGFTLSLRDLPSVVRNAVPALTFAKSSTVTWPPRVACGPKIVSLPMQQSWATCT